MIEILHSKIHRAVITDANIDYEGSITISEDLMIAADIIEYQKVLVVDINNGVRLETYVIKTDVNNVVCLNGAAAKLVSVGDKVIIMSYKYVDYVVPNYRPIVVKVDDKNSLISE